MSRQLAIVILALVAVCLQGCVSPGAGDDAPRREKLEKAIAEIQKESAVSEEKLLKGHSVRLEASRTAYIQRHFARADEIVAQHAPAIESDASFWTAGAYAGKRRVIHDYTARLKVSLAVVESTQPFAIAFPAGLVVLSRALAESFALVDEGYDSLLLGILIHEIVHLRDGHALEQWASADGRNALVSGKVLGSLADGSALIPPLSEEAAQAYPAAFGSVKQLPELSEYAADLAAVSLLSEQRLDPGSYLGYLSKVGIATRNDKGILSDPFAWLPGRTTCFRMFSGTETLDGISQIIIGSGEDGGREMFAIDLQNIALAYKAADKPDELRAMFANPGSASDAQLRAKLLEQIQRNTFTACAIRQTFSANRVENGILSVPGFDPMIFFRYH